jgi:phosphate transport system substrate-binding protein
VADNGAGNFAYARSSRGRGSSDPSNIDFWAFGLDAVTWAHYSGGAAPANLTAAQINGIYTCKYTNWNQVGGKAGTIQRFFPQVGSGTGKFFATLFLGGNYPSNTGGCPVTYVQENDGTQVTGAAKADAILPYSFAVYTAQGNTKSGEKNLHNGALLGAVNGISPSLSTVSESQATKNISGDACTSVPVHNAFCGSRYVYHVTDQAVGTKHTAYQAAIIGEVGVPTSGATTSGFCGNKYASTIQAFGFKPLGKATTAQSTSSDPVPGKSYCRQF